MRPSEARELLSGDWPPRDVEHWPPRDKSRWRAGMTLQGVIEAVMTLPRPDGSKHRGEPYPALYVRPLGGRRLVMWHGWHTAAEDVGPMHPAPGLLFTAVYRGEQDSGFEDFKYLVTPYDPEPQADRGPTPDQVREAQREATATRNGHDRPAPGTAARQAAREAAVPTVEEIQAVTDRAGVARLLSAEGLAPEFRAAVVLVGRDPAAWRQALLDARQAVLQEA